MRFGRIFSTLPVFRAMGVRRILCLACALAAFCCATLYGQAPPRVEARFEPDSIMIGDRFKLKVDVTKDIIQITEFPGFEGNLNEYMEIVGESGVDTVKRDGRTVTLRKEYTLTTFEEGYHSAGRFPLLYMDKNIIDTIYSVDSMLLKVATFDIDTVSQTIFDIKPPLKAPVKLGEFSGYLFMGLLALAAIAALIYYIVRMRNNRPLIERRAPKEPPHVTAIKQLEKLHAQKLWQSGKHKQYYTQLTDILREYIEKRFGVTAMEMTSGEIKAAMAPILTDVKTQADLSEVLVTADFVKFAKYTPEGELNEDLYHKAYYFVENTKQETPPEPADVEYVAVEPLTEQENADREPPSGKSEEDKEAAQ